MDSPHGIPVIHRNVDTSRKDLGVEIAEIIADLEETNPECLTPIWDCIGNVLEPLSSMPASPDAQLLISFSYEGYRISVDQDGEVLLVPVEE